MNRDIEIKGNQFGVRLKARGPDDNHICIQLLGEDDEHWFEVGNGFSNFWLDDLILVLNKAKKTLKTFPDDPSGCGKQFGKQKKRK